MSDNNQVNLFVQQQNTRLHFVPTPWRVFMPYLFHYLLVTVLFLRHVFTPAIS